MMNGFLVVRWNFDPELVNIFGLEIRWYGLMWALAILVGSLLFVQFVRREGLKSKVADSIFIYGTLATVIGARLGHCFFYDPGYYIANPLQILNIRDGGLASHGAAVGLLIGLWLFSKKNKLPYLWGLDRIMIAVAIGGTLIRLGNLFNSEIYGHATTLPWGFIFERNGETVPKHPTQLYEALCYFLLFFLLCFLYYKKDLARRRPGLIFGVALIGIFLSRFFIEFVKEVQVDFENNMFLDMGQWLSIPFIILGVVMIVYGLRHKVTPPPLADPSFFPKRKDKNKTAAKAGPKTETKAKAEPKPAAKPAAGAPVKKSGGKPAPGAKGGRKK